MTRHPLLTLLMVGIILVLPGVCALGFMIAGGLPRTAGILSIWAICLLISAGGAFLLYKIFQEPPTPTR
jgi:hypothetical protein